MAATTRVPSCPVRPRPRALGDHAGRRRGERRAAAAPVRACTARGAQLPDERAAVGSTAPLDAPQPGLGAGPGPSGAAGSALVPVSRLRGDAGMATAEYAVATLAACGFAGLLVALLTSGEVRGLLLAIIQRALTIG